jgi:tRNA-specific 2-thiouridylase
MCNQEVKFKLFLETALEDGADMIATGHYAKVENAQLKVAADDNKDQTYFLYRVTKDALAHTLFPLGDMHKPDVRKKAAEFGLITAKKKDSVGICFVGEIGIKQFLQNFVTAVPGPVVDVASGTVVGEHEGAIFYTVGQRHGLGVGGGLPYYVIGKDMAKNEVYVSSDLDDKELWSRTLTLTDVHWINDAPKTASRLKVRVRHRGPLIEVEEFNATDGQLEIRLKDQVRALAPGQSGVLYQDDTCLGGGVII